jgi:hypothetical protein
MPVVYLEKSDVGATLPTWLYCSTWMVYTAKQMGLTPYVHWPKVKNRSLIPFQDQDAFAKCPNMYEWWFRQPCWDQPSPPPRDMTWEWEHCPELGQHPIFSQSWPDLKEFYRTHLLFNDQTQRRIDALTHKYQIDFDRTIGLSWRGCDNVMDGRVRVDIAEYFPAIDAILASEPDMRIFATAEEQTVAERVQEKYGSRVFLIPEFYSAPYGSTGHSDYANPASGYEKGIQVCGMISVLSRCKHYIRNWSSQSCIVNFLSRGHVVNIRCGDLVRDV